MSLQSPFGPDVNAQLMALQGGGGQFIPSRDPADMGSREQFMRMLDVQREQQMEGRAAEERAYQRQKETEERSFGRQMEMMQAGTRQQMATQQNQAYLNQQAQERALAKMQQYEAEEDEINSAMVTADQAKRQDLLQRKAQLLQDKNKLQTTITQAEARVAGLGQQAKIGTENLIREFQTAYEALNKQEQEGIARGTSIDWTNTIKNKILAARSKASGSGVVDNLYTGAGGYSDAHFALQDEALLNALVAFGDEASLTRLAETAGEGGLGGVIGRNIKSKLPNVAEIFGIEQGATIKERIAAGKESTRGLNKANYLWSMIGDDLSMALVGQTDAAVGTGQYNPAIALKQLFMDAETLRQNMGQGNQAGIDQVRDRMKKTMIDLGGNTLGPGGLIEFLKSTADSFDKVKGQGDKPVASPRFARTGETGVGSTDDLMVTMGPGMAAYLRDLAATASSVFKSGEIQTASQYKSLVEAIKGATQPSTGAPGTGAPTVTLDERTLDQLLGGLMPGYGGLQGGTGTFSPSQINQIKTLRGILADISGEGRGIAATQKQIMDFMADPANAQLLGPDAQAFMDLMATQVAQTAGTRARQSLKSSGIPPAIPQPRIP